MGTLNYGGNDDIAFDDRALMHLQIVITAKLRRKESFLLSWTDAPETGSGRGSIWLDPSCVLYYRYSSSRIPSINREWVETLMASANSGSGLVFIAEPTPALSPTESDAAVPDHDRSRTGELKDSLPRQ